MTWPTRVQEIVNAMYAKNLDLAHSKDENDRRLLTLKIAQQVCFELGPEYGTKRGDGPQSKDSISKLFGGGPSFLNWDWQNGDTRKPNIFPESLLIEDQHFIAVGPVDHLGVGDGGGTGDGDDPGDGEQPPPPVDLTPILVAIEKAKVDILLKMQQGMDANERQYQDLVARFKLLVPPKPPIYEGSIFGYRLTLTPRS